ncbi:unnamed protein product [Rangifer tarandus platyrhynchus]|uniref:Uncharacterized protein n=2 Tax=Rangifer tarandus platyrhynchus TaxID=3082113 RepID=A0AC59Y8D1_RANTA|nr:unnamed protein product [Rangifer tarandus platyrhynchus]
MHWFQDCFFSLKAGVPPMECWTAFCHPSGLEVGREFYGLEIQGCSKFVFLFFRNDIIENISQSSSSLKQIVLRVKDIDTHLGSWGKESPLKKGVPPHPPAT